MASNSVPTSATHMSPMVDQSSAAIEHQRTALQQLYNEKQTNLLMSFQRAQADLALQHRQHFLQLFQQPANGGGATGSCGDLVEAPPDASVAADLPTAMRNRRAHSGSSATISPHTRERLRDVLLKKQRHRDRTYTVATNSAHFEPYPLRLSSSLADTTDQQLRRVSSEPNLKVRQYLRAKLMHKGQASSVDEAVAATSSAFRPVEHDKLCRSESDSAARLDERGAVPGAFHLPSAVSLPDLPADRGHSAAAAAAAASHQQNLLLSALNPWGLTAANLMAQQQGYQAGGAPLFGSLPSLLAANYQSLSAGGAGLFPSSNASLTMGWLGLPIERNGTAASSSADFAHQRLPVTNVSNQSSLLKQQLRELIYRRRSIVPEEPEEEINVDSLPSVPVEVSSTGRKTGLAHDSSMSKHQCVCGENKNHVEHGGRVHSVWARLLERGLVDRCERISARKATLDQLRLCHTETYVTFFGVSPTACLKMDPSHLPLRSFVQLPCGGIGVDSDTYFNDASTQLAARLAVGCLAELVVQVAEGTLRNGFAAIRPPGHHAERDQAMGFCFFNNVAVACRVALQRCAAIQKVAIVDWDVHHGNGTQLAFESEANVLYVSLHRHDNGNFFPGTGAVTEVGCGRGRGFTVNVPFSGGPMGDAEYLAAWRVVVEPVLDEFGADLVLVSAGFDGARGHSAALGGYELTAALYGYLTRRLLRYAGGKVVLALEGGYDLAAISDAAEQCVKVLTGADDGGRLSHETMTTTPRLAAQEAIQKAVAVHRRHWKGLTGEQGLAMSEADWESVQRRFATLSV